MGAKKTQSFGSGMNGQGLNSSVLRKPWGCFLAEESPDMRYEYSPCLNDLEKYIEAQKGARSEVNEHFHNL